MARQALDRSAIDAALGALDGWTLEGGDAAIAKDFKFRTFNEAFGFMARVAMVAERLDHHPEWSNVYNMVDVRLSTHDAGGVTTLDFKLAKAMDDIAGALKPSQT